MKVQIHLGLLILAVLSVMACATSRSARDSRAPASIDSGWEYKLVEHNGKMIHYWQLNSGSEPEPVEVTDRRERQDKDQVCPAGMVFVAGMMKKNDPQIGDVELLQESDEVCKEWLDKSFPRRCARFDETAWKRIAQRLPSKQMTPFCIDRYEYPNLVGSNPAIDIDWHEAKALCEKDSKRLCNEDEWTFACEGPDALPYPYGYVRDKEKCNIDRPWKDFNKVRLSPRDRAGEGLALLWQGEPIGSRPECKSPFGVYDLTGNVDEWTESTRRTGFRSIFKGGYWSVVRNRCRPSTRAHNEEDTFYQEGFRCCKSL